ncbi:hypothetical protein FJT64_006632 [Amphibalanus amphitrite]|uniref:Uncharacterized protein n=1 Tax=Amphibalanus amphitrite TaxID=1232801 RepID=A0A6A4W281_AMPAM|nr:hypothetical protein FJT64_006632 [Amphibalanus amphitrite]
MTASPRESLKELQSLLCWVFASPRSPSWTSARLMEQKGFAYVLPYKMNQDRMELFIRILRMGGFEYSPNKVQLQHALLRLALHNFISPSATGNNTAPADGMTTTCVCCKSVAHNGGTWHSVQVIRCQRRCASEKPSVLVVWSISLPGALRTISARKRPAATSLRRSRAAVSPPSSRTQSGVSAAY